MIFQQNAVMCINEQHMNAMIWYVYKYNDMNELKSYSKNLINQEEKESD